MFWKVCKLRHYLTIQRCQQNPIFTKNENVNLLPEFDPFVAKLRGWGAHWRVNGHLKLFQRFISFGRVRLPEHSISVIYINMYVYIYLCMAHNSWPDPLNRIRITKNNHDHKFDSAFIHHHCLCAIYHIVLINTFKV